MITWPQNPSELRNILGISPGPTRTCHGTTQKKASCKRPISGDNSCRIDALLLDIVLEGSATAANPLLRRLAGLVLCQTVYHQKLVRSVLERWEKALPEPTESEDESEDSEYATDAGEDTDAGDDTDATDDTDYTDDDEDYVSVDTISAKPEDPKAASPEDLKPIKAEIEPDTERLQSPPASLQPKLSKVVDIKLSATASISKTICQTPTTTGDKHTFVTFGAPRTIVQLNKSVRRLIRRPLFPDSELPGQGFIYVYTFPERYRLRSPHLKIGFSKDVPKRMVEWERLCGYKPSVLSTYSAELYVKIEKLVHAQLWNERRKELSCPTCSKCHLEWFKVRESDVSQLISLWTTWSRLEPYDDTGCLKKEWVDKLDEVDLSDPECWVNFLYGKEAE